MGYRAIAQDKQLRHLEGRLDAAFWNPAFRKARPVLDSCVQAPRSPARLSGIRLNPLPVSTREGGYAFPSAEPQSPGRSQPGHLGVLRDMRRSKPTSNCDWWPLASSQADKLPTPNRRMFELLAPMAHGSGSETSLRVSKDIRVRRIRKPVDFGMSLTLTDGQSMRRTTSAATVALAPSLSAEGREAKLDAPQLARCSSVPATGTRKADEEAVAVAKQKAILTFQRLFVEEMAQGDEDANEAAARALLRLSEAPRSAQVAIPAPCVAHSVQP